MRIVLWGTYDTGKPRVRILRDGLRAHGVQLTECHVSLWQGIEDKSAVRGVWRWLGILVRMAIKYPCLIWRFLRLPKHDLVLVAYPGLVDIFVIRLFAWLRRTPVAWDWFISAYDTIVLDRQLIGRRNPLAWVLWFIEWLAVQLADMPFMDTAAHARRMERLFRLHTGTVGHVWVGAETSVFTIKEVTVQPTDKQSQLQRPWRVLFYGQFIPLHGVGVIVNAARLSRETPIEWVLIGRGQEAGRIRSMLEKRPLPNLRWVEWVEYRELVDWIRAADICLGIFGSSEKAASVIPNKVFQIVAAGRPLITRDSPAIGELLGPVSPWVTLVPPADPQALAEAVDDIIRVHRNTGASCAVWPAYQELVRRFDPLAIADQFVQLIKMKFNKK